MGPSFSLPNTFDIPKDKLTKFLLDRTGRKPERAAFFLSHGFDVDRPAALGEALYRHAVAARHAGYLSNAYGYSVVYEGSLVAPTGTIRDVRSVWQVDAKGPPNHARFITAYRFR